MLKRITGYIKDLPRGTRIRWSIFVVLFTWFWFSLPGKLFVEPTSFIITDKDGQLLNASIAADGQWRFPQNDTVPYKFAQCILAFEDKRFYHHPGVDPFALLRAIYLNATQTKVVSGGSTINMQVIRMSKRNAKRHLWNKLTETILALRLEMTNSKRTILSLYASNAPFGSNVVGLDAAAWRYYGQRAGDLTWGQMATLAVLPNAPSLVHPGRNREVLLKKRNQLLDRLVKNGTIDEMTAELAKLEALPAAPKPLPQAAPHLAERFKKDYRLLRKKGMDLSTGVQTTIHAGVQEQVNEILERHHQQLKGNHIKNAAAIVVEIETGHIVSYAGNIYRPEDPELESHVDVLSAVRSPGSTLKPLLYASLMTEGSLLPRQLLPDIPTQIGGFAPANFDLGFDGAVPAHRAIARSLNIPAVKMLQQYKYQRFYHQMKQFGFSSLDRPATDYGMSLILGGCEVSPFELAGVYSSMARMYLHQTEIKGEWNGNDWFMPMYRETGKIESNKTSGPLLDYTSIWHTFNAMNEVARPGEEGLWSLFGSAQRIAWKTGTSFGFRDAWSIGLTPKYCVVVWVGNTTGEGRPELTGINTAAPIMFDIFRALPRSAWFEPPAQEITYIDVCRETSFKSGTSCNSTTKMLVSPAARTNAPLCPYHKLVHLDRSGSYQVTELCESPAEMKHVPWFVLPPAMEFYYRQKHADYKPLPSFLAGCEQRTEKTMDIIYPQDQAKIYVPLELSGERGKTIFTATHRKSASRLFWHLDNNFAGTTEHFHQLALNPGAGKHVLTVVDESGESITRHFEVVSKER